MWILNEYSFIFVSLFVIVGSFILLRRLRFRRRFAYPATVTLGIILLVAYLLLRPGLSDVSSLQAAEDLLGNGKPTFVEFFSNYCAGCVSVRPVVDLIVDEIEPDFNILRVDIHTDFGRALRENYGFSFTPEFVLFDGEGKEIWRSHLPPTQADLNFARNS
jgi:thiol-disulfide isomerase/thioredoxin